MVHPCVAMVAIAFVLGMLGMLGVPQALALSSDQAFTARRKQHNITP
jgi:hypothetical protein